MRKFIVSILIVITMLFTFGCAAEDENMIIGYDWAVLSLPNGNVIEGEVKGMRNMYGDQVQVIIDDVLYYTHFCNVVLIDQ